MSKHILAKFFNKYNDLQTDTIALFAACFNIPIYEREIWNIVQTGDLEKFKLMDKSNADIAKLLQIAVFNDHIEIVKYMMNLWDINPDAFYAQRFKNNVCVIHTHYYTLSWIASFVGSIDILKYLSDIKADIRKQWEDEMDIESPLFIAKYNNQTEIIKLLESHIEKIFETNIYMNY